MSVTPDQQRETEQVVGTLTGIVQKGADKFQAVVQPDNSQYTKNLWTKDQNLVATLSSQIGNRLAFLCNVSNWNMADGTPVRSLWIEQVGSPAVAAPQQPQVNATVHVQPATMTVPQPQPAPQVDTREEKIHRQTASKVAAILLGYLPEAEQNLTTLLVISERLCRYYESGVTQAVETLDDLIVRAMPMDMDSGGPSLPADDDIPF